MNLSQQIIAISHRQYIFDVDIQLETNRALFTSSEKAIYKLKWLNQQNQEPASVLVQIKGSEAVREASFCLYLSCHPHIIRTFGLANYQSDSILLVQEYAPDGDLAELLRERRFIPSEDVLAEIFMQICDAMICLADNGIVHGDLACRNVLVFRTHPSEPKNNLVKLTDFGLTRGKTTYSVESNIASSTRIVVPIRYAAPEILQTMDTTNYSEKSDVYSMGVLMWEAFSVGKIPYSSIEKDDKIIRRKLRGQILSQPNCSDDLWKIINECWHKSPTSRYDFRLLKQSLLMIQLRRPVKKRETSVTDLSNRLNSVTMRIVSHIMSSNQIFECPFCKEKFDSEQEKSSHMDSCGSKTEQCSICNKYIIRAEFVYHRDCCSTNNRIESVTPKQIDRPIVPEMVRRINANNNDDGAFGGRRKLQHFSSMRVKTINTQKTVQCEFCHGDYDKNEHENHQRNCFRRPQSSPIQPSASATTINSLSRSNSDILKRPKPPNQGSNNRHPLCKIPEYYTKEDH